MAIAGERPETGVRIAIERDPSGEAPWRYAGAAHLPEGDVPIRVTVSAAGDVEVTVDVGGAGAPGLSVASAPDLAERVRLIVRAVFRQAAADGAPPAWRIVRWRGEK